MSLKSFASVLFLSAIIAFTFSSCTGTKATVTGLENEGYLEFTSSTTRYSERVEVFVGDREPFYALVFRDKPNRIRTEKYALPPGNHKVLVRYNGVDIYQQTVFLSAQETRKIELP